MAEVEPKDLILSLQNINKEEYRIKEQKEILEKFSEKELVQTYSQILSKVDSTENSFLRLGIYSALLGSLYAFKERELDPLSSLHFPIFKTIEDDIRKVFEEIKENLEDEEIWKFECFDYGIKHVYYLDWRLYLSKICY
jgi:RNA binding exosome subunit